jgi:hypothetical protein
MYPLVSLRQKETSFWQRLSDMVILFLPGAGSWAGGRVVAYAVSVR